MNDQITILIPVYENKNLFLENLKKNKPYFKNLPLIVVNDSPWIDFTPELNTIYPNTTLIVNSKNLGFGNSVNNGAKLCQTPYLMLLNSDVILLDDSYRLGIKEFHDHPDLFALAFYQESKKANASGGNSAQFKNGFLIHKAYSRNTLAENFWAEGGAMLCQHKLFQELGGFDPLYSPFYWEDIDLSYRAWKRGYSVFFAPEIKVLHEHETTIGNFFSQKKVKTIAYRNSFIFHWKNFSDPDLKKQHLNALPKRIGIALLTGDFAFISGFIQALLLKPKITKQRKKEQQFIKYNDQTILQKFSQE